MAKEPSGRANSMEEVLEKLKRITGPGFGPHRRVPRARSGRFGRLHEGGADPLPPTNQPGQEPVEQRPGDIRRP